MQASQSLHGQLVVRGQRFVVFSPWQGYFIPSSIKVYLVVEFLYYAQRLKFPKGMKAVVQCQLGGCEWLQGSQKRFLG